VAVLGVGTGTIIGGDFKVERPLGSGGMGSVWVARQISTDKERALKLMAPELAKDPKFCDRFAQEARVGARIDSDHVVDVVAAGIDAALQTPWLAMELLRGEEVADLLAKKGSLPPHEALEILTQLAHALSAAHRAGVVHRDLKPENLFLATSRRSDGAPTLKVLDFGIAKIISEAQMKTTATMGSPLWMAPEQAIPGRPITPATDIWAYGLIAFRMLSGVCYWKTAGDDDSTPVMVVSEIMTDPIEPASKRAHDLKGLLLPPGFDDWFFKCVVRDPSQRFQSIDEALAGLRGFLGGGRQFSSPSFPTAAMGPMMHAMTPVPPTPAMSGVPPGFAAGPTALSATAGPSYPPGPPTHPMTHPMPGASTTGAVGVPATVPAQQPQKSNVGLYVGIGLGAAVLAGGGMMFALSGDGSTKKKRSRDRDESAAEAAPTATATASEAAPAPTPSVLASAPEPPPSATSVPIEMLPSASASAPKPAPTHTAPPVSRGPFNQQAADAAMAGAASVARMCQGPGSAKVLVTFAPNGVVTSSQVVGGSLQGRPGASCVAAAFKGAKVPPFDGGSVSMTRNVSLRGARPSNDDCGCASGDLNCSMRCAARKRRQAPTDI